MNLLTKECEVCGTKINKLQSIWNIYLLKTGAKIKCLNCNSEYKTYRIIAFFGYFYTWSGASLIPLILLVSFIDSFHLKLGIEVWLYAFSILSIVEFIIMFILPLKKIENETKDN